MTSVWDQLLQLSLLASSGNIAECLLLWANDLCFRSTSVVVDVSFNRELCWVSASALQRPVKHGSTTISRPVTDTEEGGATWRWPYASICHLYRKWASKCVLKGSNESIKIKELASDISQSHVVSHVHATAHTILLLDVLMIAWLMRLVFYEMR